jgi:hypothetical protein
MKSRLSIAAILCVFMMYEYADAQYRYHNSVSVSAGAFALSGFGTNHFVGARYNYFFLGGTYFVEGSIGFGSLHSRVLENVARSRLYESDRLYAYEFVAAYDPQPTGYLPYFTVGVAGINLGGQSNFAGVIGIGKRIPLSGLLGSNQFGLRYDVRDQIFSQQVNNSEAFLTHNIVFTVGMQFHF